MSQEENESFIVALLDDPLEKLIMQLLDLEEDDEEMLRKVLTAEVDKRD